MASCRKKFAPGARITRWTRLPWLSSNCSDGRLLPKARAWKTISWLRFGQGCRFSSSMADPETSYARLQPTRTVMSSLGDSVVGVAMVAHRTAQSKPAQLVSLTLSSRGAQGAPWRSSYLDCFAVPRCGTTRHDEPSFALHSLVVEGLDQREGFPGVGLLQRLGGERPRVGHLHRPHDVSHRGHKRGCHAQLVHAQPEQQRRVERVAGHFAADADLESLGVARFHDLLERADHRRVRGIVEVRDAAVAAID